MKDKFVGKYMRLARQIAFDNNPCFSRKVGVVVVDPATRGIVGAGYNGPPEGTPHCNELSFLHNFFWPQLSKEEKNSLFTSMADSSWWWKRSSEKTRRHQICEYISSRASTQQGTPSTSFLYPQKDSLCFAGAEFPVYNAQALL